MPTAIAAGRLFPPLDRRLRIPSRGSSSRLIRKICEANKAGSFHKASELLSDLAGLDIGPKRVQLTTERVGNLLAEQRDRRTEHFMKSGTAPPAAQPPARLLVVSADGGRVQTRQQDPDKKWKEDKLGIVYDALPCPEVAGRKYRGPKPRTLSVVGTMAPWLRLGEHLSACAERRGQAQAEQVVFVSDGAETIRTMRQDCFCEAAFVLDWKHATDNVRRVAAAAFGLSPQADAWYKKQTDRLWRGRADLFLKHIAKLARDLGPPKDGAPETDPARVVANAHDYFRTNRAGLDYADFRRKGWPLASSHMESTIKQVGKRIKGSEKHWTLPGVEETLQVTTLLVANDGAWEDFWKQNAWASRN